MLWPHSYSGNNLDRKKYHTIIQIDWYADMYLHVNNCCCLQVNNIKNTISYCATQGTYRNWVSVYICTWLGSGIIMQARMLHRKKSIILYLHAKHANRFPFVFQSLPQGRTSLFTNSSNFLHHSILSLIVDYYNFFTRIFANLIRATDLLSQIL